MTRNLIVGSCLAVAVAGCSGQNYGAPPERGVTNMQPENAAPPMVAPAPHATTPPVPASGASGRDTNPTRGTTAGETNRQPATTPASPKDGGASDGATIYLNGGEHEDTHRGRGNRDKDTEKERDKENKDPKDGGAGR